jgi:hypothetical protein
MSSCLETGTSLDNGQRLRGNVNCDVVYGWDRIAHLEPEHPSFNNSDEILSALFDGISDGYHATQAFYRGHVGAVFEGLRIRHVSMPLGCTQRTYQDPIMPD